MILGIQEINYLLMEVKALQDILSCFNYTEEGFRYSLQSSQIKRLLLQKFYTYKPRETKNYTIDTDLLLLINHIASTDLEFL